MPTTIALSASRIGCEASRESGHDTHRWQATTDATVWALKRSPGYTFDVAQMAACTGIPEATIRNWLPLVIARGIIELASPTMPEWELPAMYRRKASR